MIGDEATDILASDIIYNLNDPTPTTTPRGSRLSNIWVCGGR